MFVCIEFCMHSLHMYVGCLYICPMGTAKLLKGTLQTIILSLLEDKDRMYGYEITQKVKTLSDGEFKLTEGALYPALHKMEAEGLLETSTELVDGRVRKYYSLSKSGELEAKTKLSEAELFIEKLQQVLNLKSSPSMTSFEK